jgi:hexokinase
VDKTKRKVVDFLKKHKMDFEDIDIEMNVNVFLDDMERGLKGEESTLQMIPTYIETGGEIPVGESVVAIDAGGTNFRAARVKFDVQKRAIIEGLKSEVMPGVKQEVGKDEFFETMASYIRDMVEDDKSIGFCFSYPTQIFPNKDGRAILLCKEDGRQSSQANSDTERYGGDASGGEGFQQQGFRGVYRVHSGNGDELLLCGEEQQHYENKRA